MRPRTALALAVTALVAASLPAAASAKGIAALAVCGERRCHAVEARALRALEGDAAAVRRPRRAEDWYLLRARARVSDGDTAEVWTAEWLPRAGLMRSTGGGAWVAPPPRLRAALDRAAEGLRPRPAAALGALRPPQTTARVVEVFSPADDAGGDAVGPGDVAPAILAGVTAALALGAAALAVRRRAGRRTAPPDRAPR